MLVLNNDITAACQHVHGSKQQRKELGKVTERRAGEGNSWGVGRVKNSVRLGGGATTSIVPGRVREGGTPPAQQGGVGEL